MGLIFWFCFNICINMRIVIILYFHSELNNLEKVTVNGWFYCIGK
jgi:hypothetical protein